MVHVEERELLLLQNQDEGVDEFVVFRKVEEVAPKESARMDDLFVGFEGEG